MGEEQRYYITVTLVVEKDGDQYAGHCTELGTATCGATHEEALANLKEAVLVDLSALEEVGERARFFRERGIYLRRMSKRPVRRRPLMRLVDREVCTTLFDAPVAAHA